MSHYDEYEIIKSRMGLSQLYEYEKDTAEIADRSVETICKWLADRYGAKHCEEHYGITLDGGFWCVKADTAAPDPAPELSEDAEYKLLISRLAPGELTQYHTATPYEKRGTEALCVWLDRRHGRRVCEDKYGVFWDCGYWYVAACAPTASFTAVDAPGGRTLPGDTTLGEIKIPKKEMVADESGAVKADGNKIRVELIDPDFILGLGEVLTGALPDHGEHNWVKGFQWTRIIGSSMRHLLAIARGEDTDPDTGLLHAYHLGTNAMFLAYYCRTGAGTDNRIFGLKNK